LLPPALHTFVRHCYFCGQDRPGSPGRQDGVGRTDTESKWYIFVDIDEDKIE
jgi:hypothetical protein